MAVRNILRIGHPLLRKQSESVPVNEIGSKEIKKIIRDMFDSMREANGVGLAAPQIGILKRIIVVGISEPGADDSNHIVYRVLINPELKVLSGPKVGSWEGCLSVPDMRGYVERIRKIKIRFYDEKEELHEEIVEGFNAVVYQHELDHLNGTIYVDHIKDMTLFGFNGELDIADEELRKSAEH